MILAANERAIKLAEVWEDDAKRIRRYRPDAPDAEVLVKCAEEVREVIAKSRPTEVSLPDIRTRTGWSMGALRKWAREKWSPAGTARHTGGRWMVSYATAMGVPVKRDRDLSGMMGADGQPKDRLALFRALTSK